MAIKIGLGAPVVPTKVTTGARAATGLPARAVPAGKSAAPPVRVFRAPAPKSQYTVAKTNIFEKKTVYTLPPKPGEKAPMKPAMPVPTMLRPPQKPEALMPQRPTGPVKVVPNAGLPARKPLTAPSLTYAKQAATAAAAAKASGSSGSSAPTGSSGTMTAVPAAAPAAPEPVSEVAVASAPTGRTVTAAPDALPQDKPVDSGGAYVDTTSGSAGGSGGGEILSSAEEAAVAAQSEAATVVAASAPAGGDSFKFLGGIALALAGLYVWRRSRGEVKK